MLLSKCVIWGSQKSRFVKKQETSGILSTFYFKIPLSKIPLLGDILFWMQFHWSVSNEWNSKFLLAGGLCLKCI